MKRLRRIIFNALTVLSLLLCVATVVLWVRSFWVADLLKWQHAIAVQYSYDAGTIACDRQTLVFLKRGQVTFAWARDNYFWSHVPPWSAEVGLIESFDFDDLGWNFRRESETPASSGSAIALDDGQMGLLSFHYVSAIGWSDPSYMGTPIWPLLLLFGLAPALRFVCALQRWRPRHDGRSCHKCGYDLRTTPERCPECGTVPEVKE